MPGPYGQAWPALPVVCLIYVTSSDLMVPSVANKPFHPAALLLSAAQKGLTGPWHVAATPPPHGCLAGPGDTFPSLAGWAGLGWEALASSHIRLQGQAWELTQVKAVT